jgi:hypothetical protein
MWDGLVLICPEWYRSALRGGTRDAIPSDRCDGLDRISGLVAALSAAYAGAIRSSAGGRPDG